jgi:hypothetical protein
VLIALVAATALGAAAPSAPVPTKVLAATAVRPKLNLGFPIGWYDSLALKGSLPRIAGEHASAVMPYDTSANPRGYLDAAQAAGVRVLLEIPRPLVKSVDTAAVARFVSGSAMHPALLGWYLADEPQSNNDLGPLSAANATKLYRTIKLQDPFHPVAIAFGAGTTWPEYAEAMDVAMYDDYPCHFDSVEFGRLRGWTDRLDKATEQARDQDGFFPIVQAFGGTEEPVLQQRAPTLAEERYMVYSDVVAGANGIFFWTHYRADPGWIQNVFVPVSRELTALRPLLAAGQTAGLIAPDRPDVRTAAYRDKVSGATYLIVVHRGSGTVRPVLHLDRSLARQTSLAAVDPSSASVRVSHRRVAVRLGSYEVKLFRLT